MLLQAVNSAYRGFQTIKKFLISALPCILISIKADKRHSHFHSSFHPL